ncbi:MAG: glutaminase A [Tissierellia bacterium]|nr:glutaminase A [Tissierellia bacterium]
MAGWDGDALIFAMQEAFEKTKGISKYGEVASYIPVLEKVDPEYFSLSISYQDKIYSIGDREVKFSIQSISKVISLIMAIELFGKDKVFEFVGMENCDKAFNGLGCVKKIPVNPMVNAGAIVIISMLYEKYREKTIDKFIEFIVNFSGRDDIYLDEEVYSSEIATCAMNRSIVHYLNHLNLIKDDCEEILEQYIKCCSVSANTEAIALMAEKIAMGNGDKVKSSSSSIACAIMATSGMYENTGEYMMRVGIPSKSGVSGIILGSSPGKCGLAVYSPRLNQYGNSYRGVKVMEILSESLNLNIYKG